VNTAVLFKTRGETKVKIDYTLDDIWNVFKVTKLKEYTKKPKLNKELFAKIAKDLNQEIVNTIIEKNFEYYMPCSTGVLSVKKIKVEPRIYKGKLVKNLSIDYKATRELWLTNPEAREAKKKIYNMNEHSNGYRYSFYWNKQGFTAIGKKVYMFKAVRANSRLITEKTNANPHLDFYLKTNKYDRHA